MSKKSQVIFESFELFWKIFIVLVIVTVIIAVIFYYLNEKIETDELEYRIIITKFLYSPQCLACQDELKTYPALIDFDKFEKSRLQGCGINDIYGVKLTLRDLQGTALKTIDYNPYKTALLPVCSSLKDFKCTEKTIFALYKTGNEIKPALLTAGVIRNV